MQPIFFGRVGLPHLTFEQIVDAYASWTLGVDTYRRNRDRRLDLGIPPRLSPADLIKGGSYRGDHDCAVVSRRGEGTFLLRFVHRDAEDGGILWHSGVKLSTSAETCSLEHAVARSAPRGATLHPVAASPSVFVRLLERNGPDIEPRDLWNTGLLRLPEEDVEDFVSHILLDEQRKVPYLVVTPTNDAGSFLVGPEQLAKRLAGLARVVEISTKGGAFRFTAELKGRGFSNEFGVSNGSVRLFHADLHPGQSHLQHYLWLRRRIESIGETDRLKTLSGEVASRIVGRTLPLAFFDLIEEHDRRERQRAAELVLKATVSPPPEEEGEALKQAIQERDQRIVDLVRTVEDVQLDLGALRERYEEEARNRRDAEDRAIEHELQLDEQKDQLEHTIEQKESRIRELTHRLEEMKAGKVGTELANEARGAFEACIDGEPTLEQVLLALVGLYPDRLVVLPEAWKAARQSAKFRKGREALRLLRSLATEYWEALQAGKGDAQARRIFGNNYAAKESQTVENNKRAKEARTFSYNGQAITMLKHLKIGTKDSLSETLRVHFEWIAKDGLIVIGHCGGHLPFK